MCYAEACERLAKVRGLCGLHYQRLRRNGPGGLDHTLKPRDRTCSVAECGKKHESLGFCLMHLTRFRRNGEPGGVAPMRNKRPERVVSPRDGYVRVRMPDHPRSDKSGMVLEHIPALEDALGRPIDWALGEQVHHINGVKDDNRPENLELWVTSQPRGQRPADLVEWARDILARYEHEVETVI